MASVLAANLVGVNAYNGTFRSCFHGVKFHSQTYLAKQTSAVNYCELKTNVQPTDNQVRAWSICLALERERMHLKDFIKSVLLAVLRVQSRLRTSRWTKDAYEILSVQINRVIRTACQV